MAPQKRNQIGSYKRKRSSNISYVFCFPDDIIYIILLCLPADVLYNVMKFVCKGWHKIIQSPTFISTHLEKQLTTNYLLIRHSRTSGFVVKPRSHGRLLDVENINFQFVQKAWASCNGLLLVDGPIERSSNCPSYVVNPVTKQYLPLPLFPYPSTEYAADFAYASASRVYKVMKRCDKSRLFILTVGVDKEWRKVDELNETAMKDMMRCYCCLTQRGFKYWLYESSILRFDMETETFEKIPFSHPYNLDSCKCGFLATENSLCLWVQTKNHRMRKYLFEFLILKDPETGHGQWEKVLDLDIDRPSRSHPLMYRPIGWLRNMELLVFQSKEEIVVYNLNTGRVHQTKEMKITKHPYYENFYSGTHVNSLVPLSNLSLLMSAEHPYKSQEDVYSKENMKPDFEEFKYPYTYLLNYD